MAHMLRWIQAAVRRGALALLCLGMPASLLAQPPKVQYRHHADMPPGAIGSWQLQRGGPLVGYLQPVELVSPSGAKLSLAANGTFEEPAEGILAGFLIGQVYRLRVTSIPLHEGQEVFPTLEVIDRTYPPPGRALQYPIRIEISESDLELALQGKYVTRVIYLEDTRQALPVPQDPQAQEWFDVRPGEDPLQVADLLGRPVAILRMGGRVPADGAAPGMDFLYGCPPFRKVPPPEQVAPPAPAPPEERLPLPAQPPANKEPPDARRTDPAKNSVRPASGVIDGYPLRRRS
jgi:hypothetical protein